MQCPRCTSQDVTVDYSLQWDDRFGEYRVVSCDCGFSFVDPIPPPDQLERLYSSDQYHTSDISGDLSTWKQQADARCAERYSQWIHGRVLDVGCGTGLLLKHLRDQGHDVVGMEISERQVELARGMGLEVYSRPAEEVSKIEGSFDTVIFRHVLEHLYDPASVLKAARSKMTGHLIVEVPNYGSFDRRIYGRDWPAFAPYHLWYFTEKSMTNLLEEAGFHVCASLHYMTDRIKGWPRRILSRMGSRVFSSRSLHMVAY